MKRRILRVAAGIVALGIWCGCEDGGGSFDYGDNDPDVWVAMGDSITEGSPEAAPSYPERLAAMTGKEVVNLGDGGGHAYEGAARILGVLESRGPGRVLILYGINDILHHRDLDDILEDLRFMVQAAKANRSQVSVATMLPIPGHSGVYLSTARALSVMIRRMAAEEDADLVDLEAVFGTGEGLLLEDGLHPNSDGNERMARAFRWTPGGSSWVDRETRP
jgi:lysophospholipase L1-like esterase